MDRGLLAMAGMTQPAPFETNATLPDGGRSDAEIMLQVKAGDDSAFEYLVQKYRRPMVSFMFRMAHNNAAAEDLAQEVFLRVYRSRESYEASAKFTTWLYRIATNLAVNHARDTRHERPENTVSLDEPDEDSGRTLDLPDRTPTVEETIVRRERLAAIRQRVQELAGAAANCGCDAQVSADGLSPDCRCVEAERVRHQVVAVSRLRNAARTAQRVCVKEASHEVQRNSRSHAGLGRGIDRSHA